MTSFEYYTSEYRQVRNNINGFDINVHSRFKNIIFYRDLPYTYNLKQPELLRYPAYFYGFSFNNTDVILIFD